MEGDFRVGDLLVQPQLGKGHDLLKNTLQITPASRRFKRPDDRVIELPETTRGKGYLGESSNSIGNNSLGVCSDSIIVSICRTMSGCLFARSFFSPISSSRL